MTERMSETNARLYAEADREGVFDYVGVESVTVHELVTSCPLCAHELPDTIPWPTDCILCRSPHKVCGGCGAHVRWAG
jgi:hypothetical protein